MWAWLEAVIWICEKEMRFGKKMSGPQNSIKHQNSTSVIFL